MLPVVSVCQVGTVSCIFSFSFFRRAALNECSLDFLRCSLRGVPRSGAAERDRTASIQEDGMLS